MRTTTEAVSTENTTELSPLLLIKKQRSHVLFVLSNPKAGQEPAFLGWYEGAYRQALSKHPEVLSARHYVRHEVDITQGRFAPLPLRYLALYEISLDGAEAASSLIERVTELHREHPAAEAPATWLYYPSSEKVGRAPAKTPSMLTLAFANGTPGQDAQFREWYATRHTRHALNIAALVSGQCFERTQFQRPGALDASFSTIAIYEQEGTPESIIESFLSLPAATFDFPTLDLSRFAEAVYRPVSTGISDQ
jgi:hypothetical protein